MRWIKLYATTPSGKTLFVCKYCGATTPVPGKDCVSPPTVDGALSSNTCRMLEDHDLDMLSHPLRKGAILRTATLAKKIREAPTLKEAQAALRRDRNVVIGYFKTALGIFTKQRFSGLFAGGDWWEIIAIIDELHQELRGK